VRVVVLRSDGSQVRRPRVWSPVGDVYGASESVAWSPSGRRLLVSTFVRGEQDQQLLIFNRTGQRVRALPVPVSEFPMGQFPWVDEETLAVSYDVNVDGRRTGAVGLIDLRGPSTPRVVRTGAWWLTGLQPVDPVHHRALVAGDHLGVLDLGPGVFYVCPIHGAPRST
jgi:hypothetical protein